VSAPDWSSPEVHWALVGLLGTGEVRRTAAVGPLVDWLREVGWLGQGPRRDLFRLNQARRAEVEARLTAIWPDWRADLTALDAAGLPRDAAGLRQLRRQRLPLIPLPQRLHRKTWMARFGRHSKAGTPDAVPPPGLTLTDDDLLRLRPSAGLRLRLPDGEELDAADWVRRLGELVLPQRLLEAGLALTGEPPAWVMTVENLGAYLDLPAPTDALIVHQPGWNCRLAQHLIALLPEAVPWWHFGDLDPKGIAIFATLGTAPGTETRRPRLFLPDWWGDYLPTHGLPLGADWPDTPADPGHAWLAELRAKRLWLEQEAILLDPRLGESLIGLAPPTPDARP
jgi:hypothetical protein